jgi:hypothetical protein
MILQIYNWSILISALILVLHTVPDKDVQDSIPLGLNKYSILLLSLVPVLNTTMIIMFIYLEVVLPIRDWVVFQLVMYKINKLIKRLEDNEKENNS